MILVAALALAAQDPDLTQFVERAEEIAPAPAIDEIRPLVLERLQAEAARQSAACTPEGVALEAPRSATATRMIVQGIRSRQLRNAWTVYGQPIGCPGLPRFRFMAVRMADNSLRIVTVNPGESLANASLLREALQPAANAALAIVRPANAACTGADLDLAGSRVVARTDLSPDWHGTYFHGSWQEAWTFGLCGRRVEVPITFIADGQGGARFDVRAGEARMLEP